MYSATIAIDVKMKNRFESLLFVNANKCPANMLDPVSNKDNRHKKCDGWRRINMKIKKFRRIKKRKYDRVRILSW
jgi:hypothetical protein